MVNSLNEKQAIAIQVTFIILEKKTSKKRFLRNMTIFSASDASIGICIRMLRFKN